MVDIAVIAEGRTARPELKATRAAAFRFTAGVAVTTAAIADIVVDATVLPER
jgi:hypothetical protein